MFYSFEKDRLLSLRKLLRLIKENKIKIFICQQGHDEFFRNRENKLKETLKYIENFKTSLNIPSFCQEIGEMIKIKEHLNQINILSETLHKKIFKEIKAKELEADKLIFEIFDNCSISPLTDVLIRKAEVRYNLGNPPGKNDSYGDAINWEFLLENVPNKEDLFFISNDRDFRSKIDDSELSDFLKQEWKNKKNSKIIYYDTIASFLKEEFSEKGITKIQINEEKEVQQEESKYWHFSSFAPSTISGSRTVWPKIISFEEYHKMYEYPSSGTVIAPIHKELKFKEESVYPYKKGCYNPENHPFRVGSNSASQTNRSLKNSIFKKIFKKK